MTVGQLHRELFPRGDVDRRTVEHVLGGLVRAHTVSLVDDSFEKDGAVVTFQRAYVSNGGAKGGEARGHVEVPVFRMPGRGTSSPRTRKGKRDWSGGTPNDRRAGDPSRPSTTNTPSAKGPEDALFQALRSWRLAEAKRTGLPAFRVLSDRTLMAIATDSPGDEDALLRVHGIGPALAKRYGSAVLGIVARYPVR